MVRINTRELFGADLDFRLDALPLARARPRPAHVDARLQRANWVGGLKLDALDGSQAHDLIGPQDIAWDTAGAAVELGLDLRLGDPVLRRLFDVAYPAFQAGRSVMAGTDATRYRRRLARLARATESAD